MKNMKLLYIVFLAFWLLTACATPPASTTEPEEPTIQTIPSTTIPSTTTPIETTPSMPHVTEPQGTESLGEFFKDMDITQIQEWFFDFSNEYWLSRMPHFPFSMGPSFDSCEYVYWVYLMGHDNWEEGTYTITQEYLEETVQVYFGVTPTQHRSLHGSYIYNEDTMTYTITSFIKYPPPFFLLNSIEYADGVYIIRATRYNRRNDGVTSEDDPLVKAYLIAGEKTYLVYPYSEITLSFRLDSETSKPVFCGLVEESLIE